MVTYSIAATSHVHVVRVANLSTAADHIQPPGGILLGNKYDPHPNFPRFRGRGKALIGSGATALHREDGKIPA
jgi:hypothetical protein